MGFFRGLAEQLGADGTWYVQLAAIWRWHLPLFIYIIKYFLYTVTNRGDPVQLTGCYNPVTNRLK